MAGSNKTRYYEYIVIGCGGIGSGTLYWLSKRSKSVLGIEQFNLGHVNGGSQDFSRIIRLDYADTINCKLTPDTYKAWEEVERDSGIRVVWKTGTLQLGIRGETDDIVDKYADSMDKTNIRYERLNNRQLMARYPQFTVGPDTVCLYQKDGGVIDAAMANAVNIQLARGNGANILENCSATRISRAKNGNVVLTTTKGVFECHKLMITAGGWVNQVMGSIGVHIPITVTQEQVTYFATPHMKQFTKDKYPAWTFHSPDHTFYALPIHGNTGTKIGLDVGGHVVTPNTRNYDPDPVQEKVCTDLLNEICPKFLGPILKTKTCLYTLTPDRHFVVDTCAYKGWSDVIVCCGAGHGFRFASLLGKILSELAADGRTQYDISHFKITRDAIQDPNFQPMFYLGRDTPSKL